MPWWASGADPKWRPPPRAHRPGASLDRLRERLWEILEDANSEAWFAALRRLAPAPVLGRFLDGEDDALTADELKAVGNFGDEFGYDMRTGRLHRRPTAPPVSLRSRP
jgi:hypothetical protein